MSGQGLGGGTDDGGTEPRHGLNETPPDSDTGEADRRSPAPHPRAPHRHGLLAGGLPAHPQGRGRRRRSPNRRRVRRRPGGEPPHPAGPREVGTLPSAGGPTGAHPERDGPQRDPPDWDSDLRGQGSPARRQHGARGGLRAGVSRLLVWVSARPLRAPGVGVSLEGVHGDAGRLGVGAGPPPLLRHPRSWPAPGRASPAGAGRRPAAFDRQVAARGRAGGGAGQLPRGRHTAGGSDLPAAEQHLPAHGARCVVRAGGPPPIARRAMLLRYADDAVLVFACEEDACRVWSVLPRRLARYGLTLHPEKPRLVPFRRPGRGLDQPGTFDFLGFTHHWARSRQGQWVIKRKTARDRFNRAVKAGTAWCRLNRHAPLRHQEEMLARKLQGHFAYYGITGNSPAIARFRFVVVGAWCKWLRRRSWKSRLTWDRFKALLARYPLPPARAIHSRYRLVANP